MKATTIWIIRKQQRISDISAELSTSVWLSINYKQYQNESDVQRSQRMTKLSGRAWHSIQPIEIIM